MRYYETLYIINPELADDDYRDVISKFNSHIEQNKGVLVKLDEWGKKTLAYEVKKFDKGYYVLLNYCGDPDIITSLNREFKLDERVLKYQTIKLSDKADPEALKKEAEEVQEKVVEEAKEEEKEEAQETVSEEAGTSEESISEEEGKNGVLQK
jgi:small subunit ribosomal protein S6